MKGPVEAVCKDLQKSASWQGVVTIPLNVFINQESLKYQVQFLKIFINNAKFYF